MKIDRIDAPVSAEIESCGREAWVKPAVKHLRAGSAEAIPGDAVLDGSLETIGS
jgi:hypothetical protein